MAFIWTSREQGLWQAVRNEGGKYQIPSLPFPIQEMQVCTELVLLLLLHANV